MTKRRLLLAAAVAILAVTAGAVRADEPAQAFLDGLRERNYYDVALDYLIAAEKNPAVPAAFKETIPYESGTTHFNQSDRFASHRVFAAAPSYAAPRCPAKQSLRWRGYR